MTQCTQPHTLCGVPAGRPPACLLLLLQLAGLHVAVAVAGLAVLDKAGVQHAVAIEPVVAWQERQQQGSRSAGLVGREHAIRGAEWRSSITKPSHNAEIKPVLPLRLIWNSSMPMIRVIRAGQGRTMQWLVKGVGAIAQVDAVQLSRQLPLHLQVLLKHLLPRWSVVVLQEGLARLGLATLGDADMQPVCDIPACGSRRKYWFM
jgi:hypothetical protein